MSIDFKALKRIADVCRKAGISQFKNADFEFTLSPDGPVSNYKKRKQAQTIPLVKDESIQVDDVSNDALLFWSVAESVETEESKV